MALSIGEIYATLKLRDELSAGLASAERSLRETGLSLQRLGSHISEAGSAMLPLSAAVTAFGYTAVTMFADFERGMNRVRAVTGSTDDAMQMLTRQAEMLGATTVYTARDAADAMGYFGLAGFDALEIYGSMPSTLQLAAAGAMGVGDAANITAKIMRGYSIETEHLGHMNDVLVKAFTRANTDLVQLGESFKHAGPVAYAAGLQFEETTAALALMADAGFQGSMAGTSLRNAIQRLLQPIGAAKDIHKEWNLVTTDSNGQLLSLDKIIQQLEPHADDVGKMLQLLGMRGGPAFQALLERGSGELRRFTEMLEHSGGTAARIEKIQLEGLKGAFVLLESAVEGAMISIGRALEPSVTPVVRRLTEWASVIQYQVVPWFRSLPEPIQQVSVAIGAMVAVGAPLLMTIGSLVRVFGFALEGVAGAAKFMGTALGALNLSKLMGPFKTLSDLVKTFGLSLGLSEGFAMAWFNVTSSVTGAAAAAWSSMSGVVTGALTVLRAVLTALSGPIGWIVSGLTLLATWLVTTDEGSQVLSKSWQALKSILSPMASLMSSLGSILKDVVAIAFMVVSDSVSAVAGWLSDLWGLVKSGIKWLGDVAGEFVQLGLSVAGIIPGGSQFVQVFGLVRDVVKSLATAAKGAADKVHEFAQATGAVSDELPKVEGPFKDLHKATSKQQDLQHLLSQEFTDSITPIRKLGEETGGLSEEQRQMAARVKELADQYNGTAIREGFNLWMQALPDIGDLSKQSAEDQQDIMKAIGELIDKAYAMGVEVPPSVDKAYRSLADIHVVKKAMSDLSDEARTRSTEILQALDEKADAATDVYTQKWMKTLNLEEEAWGALYDLVATETDKALVQASKWRDGQIKAIEPLKTLAPAEYERARQRINEKYAQMEADARNAGQKQVGTFTQEMAKLPDVIMGAIQGGGDVFKSVFSHIGKTIMSEENALTGMLHNGISKISTKIGGEFGAQLSMTLGAALPAIGALLGPAMSALGDKLFGALFGSKGRDLVKEFAATFEGGFDGLREKLNALGSEGERLWVQLTQGVGKNNPAQAKAAIEAIEKALAAAEAETKAINEALGRYGVTWENFPGEQRAKGFADAVRELTRDTDLLVKGGLTYEGAIKAQAEAYNELIRKSALAGQDMPLDLLKVTREMAQLGLLTEETMAALMGGADATMPKWQDMQKAAEKYGIELGALGDKFRQAKLGDTLREYATDFDLLVKGGADAALVAAGMADEVNKALSEALKYGLEVPASMRPLLQALLDSGKLLDQNGEVMKDLSKVKFGETLAESTSKLIAKISELIDALTKGMGGAIDGIRGKFQEFADTEYDVRVNVKANWPEGPEAGGSGGIAARTSSVMFPSGSYAEDADGMGPAAVPQAQGRASQDVPASGDIYILVQRNGEARRLGPEEFRQLERAMADGVVKVPARAIGSRVR